MQLQNEENMNKVEYMVTNHSTPPISKNMTNWLTDGPTVTTTIVVILSLFLPLESDLV